MDFHMVASDSMDHGHLPGLWHQHMPWTPAWLPMAECSMDTNMVRGQPGPQISTWLHLAVIQVQLQQDHGPQPILRSPSSQTNKSQ